MSSPKLQRSNYAIKSRVAQVRSEPTPAPIITKSPVNSGESSDHSIAVLPFDNLSGDPAQEYFSDGITESIILNLSLFPGLNVKSRNSSFAFKQQIKSPDEISKELEVDYLVEGSIRKTSERVRVTVQLVEATSGNQIWGKRYDKPLDELFEVEEDLVRNIAGAISGRIGREVRIIASKKPASDMKSFDYLMRGWYYHEQHNPEASARSIECHKIVYRDRPRER